MLSTPHLTLSWSSVRSRKARGPSVVLDTPKVEERSWSQGPRLAQEHTDCSPADASQRRLRALPACPPNTVARRTPRSQLSAPAPWCGSGSHTPWRPSSHRTHTPRRLLPPHADGAPALAIHPPPSCWAGDVSRPLHARAIPMPHLKEEAVTAQSIEREGPSATRQLAGWLRDNGAVRTGSQLPADWHESAKVYRYYA